MHSSFPGSGVLWFFFNKGKDLENIGTPFDIKRKFQLLEEKKALNNGFEMFLIPSKLKSVDDFDSLFYSKISKLKYKTVHIADSDKEFLLDPNNFEKKLPILTAILENFETNTIVLHAHHLLNERIKKRDLIKSLMPKAIICVENNGADCIEAGSPEALVQIFKDYPAFKLCLDLCHVTDLNYSLTDFIESDALKERVQQIHFSYSVKSHDKNLYAEKGYDCNPHHALWSVVEKFPSSDTMNFSIKYPVIIEGVVPYEDSNLDLLKKEFEVFD